MGKTLIQAYTIAWTLALLVPIRAEADKRPPHLARALPSRVKTVYLVPRGRTSARAAPAATPAPRAPRKASVAAKAKLPRQDLGLSPELQREADDHPFAAKYFSRSVYFVRSDYPLSADYDCDGETQERKMQEAESQARARCAQGREPCRLVKALLVKTGSLRCSDFPGKKCPGRGHFRGCVAEALVLGEKEESPAITDEALPEPERSLGLAGESALEDEPFPFDER